jgi:hypothetical protein
LTMFSRSTRREDHDVCVVLDRLPRPVHEKAGVSVLQTQSKVLWVVVSQSGTSNLRESSWQDCGLNKNAPPVRSSEGCVSSMLESVAWRIFQVDVDLRFRLLRAILWAHTRRGHIGGGETGLKGQRSATKGAEGRTAQIWSWMSQWS